MNVKTGKGHRPRLLVIGLGIVRTSGNRSCTRAAIAEYLSEIARYGDVTWMTIADHSDDGLNIPLPPEIRVEIVGARNPFANAVRMWRTGPHDAIIAAYPMALRIWPWLVCGNTRKTLFYIGNDITQKPRSWNSVRDMLLWHYRACIARFLARRSGVVMARGKRLASIMRRSNAQTFETPPIGMTMASNPPGDTQNTRPFLLYVGKLIPEKGLGLLLDAYRDTRWPGEKPRLKIIGTGLMADLVKERAAADPCIDPVGYINDPGLLARHFCSASALIAPTLAEWEGVPRVLSEARQFGTPVWVAALPAIREEFADDVHYLDTPVTARGLSGMMADIPLFQGHRHGHTTGATMAALQHLQTLGLNLDADKGSAGNDGASAPPL